MAGATPAPAYVWHRWPSFGGEEEKPPTANGSFLFCGRGRKTGQWGRCLIPTPPPKFHSQLEYTNKKQEVKILLFYLNVLTLNQLESAYLTSMPPHSTTEKPTREKGCKTCSWISAFSSNDLKTINTLCIESGFGTISSFARSEYSQSLAK